MFGLGDNQSLRDRFDVDRLYTLSTLLNQPQPTPQDAHIQEIARSIFEREGQWLPIETYEGPEFIDQPVPNPDDSLEEHRRDSLIFHKIASGAPRGPESSGSPGGVSAAARLDQATSDVFHGIRSTHTFAPPAALPVENFIDARLLFSLIADEFGKNSALESYSVEQVLRYVTRYIKLQQSLSPDFSEVKQDLLNQLEMSCRIQSEGISKILEEAFVTNTPLLIPAGWVGHPGHGIVYEIIPQRDGSANFRIFNTGDGSSYHEHHRIGIKQKVGFVEWRGVPRENLLDPYFAKIVNEMKTHRYYGTSFHTTEKPTDYYGKDVYKSLRGFLEPKSSSSFGRIDASMMQCQRAGTCSSRSLFACIKSKLPLAEYQRLKLDLRMNALLSFINNPRKSEGEPYEVTYHLIEKATKKLSQRVNDLFVKHAIGRQTIIAANELLKRADRWLKTHKISKERISLDYDFAAPINSYASELSTKIDSSVTDLTVASSNETPSSLICEEISFLRVNRPEIFLENINKLRQTLQKAYDKLEYAEVHFAIQQVIKQIPLDQSFWNEIRSPTSGIEQAIEDVGVLTELFFKSSYRIQDGSSAFFEKVHVLSKLVFLQKKLGAVIHFDIPFYFKLKLLTHIALDPASLDEVKHIIKYASEDFFGATVAQYSPRALQYAITGHIYPPFMNLLKKKYPEIYQKIRNDIHQFDSKMIEEQTRLVFLSPLLPPWLKSIRTSQLCLNFLLQTPIVHIENPHTSLDFQYEHFTKNYEIYLGSLIDKDFSEFAKRYASLKPNTFANLAPIENPMIRELIRNFLFLGNEKDVYSTYIFGDFTQYIDFKESYASQCSASQINELTRIFANPNYSLIEALAFFDQHREKLKMQDYQQLFLIACFSIETSHQIGTLKKQITKFLKKHLAANRYDEDIPTQVFLQRIGRYFHRYGCEFSNETKYLMSLLTSPKTTPEEKSLIYAELAAALTDYKELRDSHLTFLLKAKAWLEYTPIPTKSIDPQVMYDIEKLFSLHGPAINNLLCTEAAPTEWTWTVPFIGALYTSSNGVPNTPLLNEIYTLITAEEPPSSLTWKAVHTSGKKPRFKSNNNCFYDPIKGSFIKIGLEMHIPAEIRNNRHFKELFPLQVKGIAKTSEIYEFIDPQRTVQVKKQKGGVAIFQQYQGHKMEFIPSDKLTKEIESFIVCSLQSRYLADRYHVWHSITDPSTFFLYDKKTGVKTHQARYEDGWIVSVTRLSDGAALSKSSIALHEIEDRSYIQEWYKDQIRIEVELPRFNLSFKADETRRLYCSQDPGFFLSEDQNLHAIGACKYALILKNKEGKRRVILPNQQFETIALKESLQPMFSRMQYLKIGDLQDFTYFTYDVTSKGDLESTTLEGYFYLVQTLALHQEYQKAAYYLRTFGEKLSEYSAREIFALNQIADVETFTGDVSGEQVAIALYANYLLATNKIRSSKAMKNLCTLYKQYLFRLRNVTALPLSKEEELHLFNGLIPEEHWVEFSIRFNPNFKTPWGVGYVDLRSKGVTFIHEAPLDIFTTQAPPPAGFENSILITRASEAIKNHLLSFINIALAGTATEKKWVKTALLFYGTNEESPSNAIIKDVLTQMLEHPYQFTPPPPQARIKSNPESLERWWNQILDKVEAAPKIEEDLASAASIVAHTIHDRGPPTDRPSPQIQDLPWSFTPEIHPPLSANEPFCYFTTQLTTSIPVSRELKEFFTSQRVEDPVEAREWRRLAEDIETLSRKPANPLYRLNREVSEMISALKEKKGEIESTLTSLENLILSLTCKEAENETAKSLYDLQKRGMLVKDILLDDVFISLGCKESKKLLDANPNLSEMEIHDIYAIAAVYLQLATQKAQLDRSLTLCDKISKKPDNDELKQELARELNAKRSYDLTEHPSYLVFEYYAGIIMREDQIVKLDAFLRGGILNPFMEMIMGSGKSKILLPLLGLLRANGKDLSMVIVPSPLFESVASDTQRIMHKTFGKSLKALHFDRNSTFTKRSLEEIKTFLELIITKKQCLIMTSKSIQCLLLKFIEYTNSGPMEEIFNSAEFNAMLDIISLIQKWGHPLIDEADTILNVLHEVNFNLGDKVSPEVEEIELIGTLYEILYLDPELKKIAKLESDPSPLEKDPSTNLPVPPLSEALYHQKVKGSLAFALITQLIKQKKLPAAIDQEALYAYLTRDPSTVAKSTLFFETQPKQIQNLLALASEEICSLLPHTLLKTSDERYGLDQGVIPIPFAAVNTPSRGSQFANSYITINYSFQIHIKHGIQKNTLINFINDLKKQAHRQMEAEDIEIEETTAYKKFCHLTEGLSIPFKTNLTNYDLEQILKKINENLNTILDLIKKIFLPELKFFEYKIACNPTNLIAFFNKVSGFTGTLWNAGSMHPKITPQPEAGTDGKTLSLLMKKSSMPVLIIPKGKMDLIFAILPHFDAMIDAGGYFKEGENLGIARTMAHTYGTSVVFYDSSGIQSITNGTTEIPLNASPLKEDERLTFYDQSHTTGADIKQKEGAIGFVTIGRNMILRDLLQSVWRLRGLEKGQTVQFLIDEEIAFLMREQIGSQVEEITFKEILQFVIQNQGKMQGRDNFTAFIQQLNNLSQNLLLEVMTSAETLENKQQAYRLLAKTWIKPAHISPAICYGKPALLRSSEEVIIESSEKALTDLNALADAIPFLKERIESLKKEITSIKASFFTTVPSYVIASASDSDSTTEVEQEIEQEIEQTRQSINELQAHGHGKKIQLGQCSSGPYTRVESLSEARDRRIMHPIFPITDQMSREKTLTPYKNLFKGIDISMNILEWEHGTSSQFEKMVLFGPHKIPYHHLTIQGDNVTIFSQLEDVLKDPNYYNLTLGFADPSRELSTAAFNSVVKIKFLNGDSMFTKKEIAFLDNWLTHAGVEKMLNLYLNIILKYQPEKQSAFKQSNLCALFDRKLENSVKNEARDVGTRLSG